VTGEERYCETDSEYGRRAAQREAEELGAVGSGNGLRNGALNKSAFKLGTLVSSGHLTMETAYEAVVRGCKNNGYTEDHGERATNNQIMSGLRAGVRHPRADVPRRYDAADGAFAGVTGGGGVPEPVQGSVLTKSGLLERCQETMAKRIRMGFDPAPSPLVQLNVALGGGAPTGAVTLLGAPPGMGKSSLALAWADSVANAGKPALYCSLELSELDLYSRLCTLRHGHSWLSVRCGKHNDALFNTISGVDGIPFYSLTRHEVSRIEVLRRAIDEISQKHGSPPFVVVDYLQLLLDAMSQIDQRLQMGHISGELIHMADDLAAPVVCITAVNRASYNMTEKGSSKPDRYLALAAAKESGKLEFDAEVVMALQLLEEVENGQYGWVCIAKNRSGGGAGNIPVRYCGRSGNFFDAEEDDIYAAMAKAKEGDNKAKVRDIASKIADSLNGIQAKSADDISKAFGLPRAKTREAVGQMMSEGLVIRDFAGDLKYKHGG
jgi:replicative DNA helicase